MDWVWAINLDGLIGRDVTVETRDGHVREGRITDVDTGKLTCMTKDPKRPDSLVVPIGIQLNGDPSDIIDFRTMKSMRIR